MKEAFFAVCRDARPANKSYVSLYVEVPFYGGPEEGGWWGSDTELVAYCECVSDEQAHAVEAEVNRMAEQLNKEAKDAFGRQCQNETAWLEARGLDDDFLPEVDGEDRYWVTTEKVPGSHVRQGDRCYS